MLAARGRWEHSSLFWKAVSEGKDPRSSCLSYTVSQLPNGGRGKLSFQRHSRWEKEKWDAHSVTTSRSPAIWWAQGWSTQLLTSQQERQAVHTGLLPSAKLSRPRIVPGSVYLPIQGQGVAGGRRESRLHATVGCDQSGSDSKKLHITSNPDLFYECILRKKNKQMERVPID